MFYNFFYDSFIENKKYNVFRKQFVVAHGSYLSEKTYEKK